ncbi:lipopolysaccharide assembly protein LapA domain-containing protein [Roseimaritima sediminicola]|uniref:lipopolysaccharide assembly protein LapA domain-containing protein n=1 Tax=Roseimaritima sediminicola TaxID=2662066 RepID=UPI00129857F2|nr:lipopolysaccharide assembly protein LapA domain-containing protein [Roseimaritima sediminicola]
MLQKIKLVLVLLILVLLVLFGLLNRDPTSVDLVFVSFTLSTTLLVFVTAACGFLAGSLTTGLWLHKRARRAKTKA